MHLSKAASKMQEKKDDCADGNELNLQQGSEGMKSPSALVQ